MLKTTLELLDVNKKLGKQKKESTYLYILPYDPYGFQTFSKE